MKKFLHLIAILAVLTVVHSREYSRSSGGDGGGTGNGPSDSSSDDTSDKGKNGKTGILDEIEDSIPNPASAIGNSISNITKGVGSTVSNFTGGLFNGTKGRSNNENGTSLIGEIANGVEDVAGGLKNRVRNVTSGIGSGVSTVTGGIENTILNGTSTVTSLPKKLKNLVLGGNDTKDDDNNKSDTSSSDNGTENEDSTNGQNSTSTIGKIASGASNGISTVAGGIKNTILNGTSKVASIPRKLENFVLGGNDTKDDSSSTKDGTSEKENATENTSDKDGRTRDSNRTSIIGDVTNGVSNVASGIKNEVTNVTSGVENGISTVAGGMKDIILTGTSKVASIPGKVENLVLGKNDTKNDSSSTNNGTSEKENATEDTSDKDGRTRDSSRTSIIGDVTNGVSNVASGIKNEVSNVTSGVENGISTVAGGMKNIILNGTSKVASIPGKVESFVLGKNDTKDDSSSIKNGTSEDEATKETSDDKDTNSTSIVGRVASGVTTRVSKLANGMKNGISNVTSGIVSVPGKIENLVLGKNDTKNGTVSSSGDVKITEESGTIDTTKDDKNSSDAADCPGDDSTVTNYPIYIMNGTNGPTNSTNNTSIIGSVVEGVSDFADGIKIRITNATAIVKNGVVYVVSGIKNGITNVTSGVTNFVFGKSDTTNGTSDESENVSTSETNKNSTKPATISLSSVPKGLEGLATNVTNGVSNITFKLEKVAENVGSGLVGEVSNITVEVKNGTMNVTSGIASRISNLFSGVINKVESVTGIGKNTTNSTAMKNCTTVEPPTIPIYLLNGPVGASTGERRTEDVDRKDLSRLKNFLEAQKVFLKDKLLFIYNDEEKPVKMNFDLPTLDDLGLPRYFNNSTVVFQLFTKDNKLNYDPLELGNNTIFNVSHFNATRPTVFVTHGYLASASGPSVTLIKNAYLKFRDVNVIAVDWSKLAQHSYPISRLLIPAIGKYVGKMIDFMAKEHGLKYNKTTLIGHSLGAHLMGYAGQTTSEKVNRTIGLDPAGPLFAMLDKDERISDDDATNVDIIHTNAGELGISNSIGDYDFYPNGGTLQNGCILKDSYDACSHSRSYIYLAEQISRTGPEYYALKCNSYGKFRTGQCLKNNVSIMGELENVPAEKGDYYLDTRASSPYGVGPNFFKLTF